MVIFPGSILLGFALDPYKYQSLKTIIGKIAPTEPQARLT
jgi:hypothetical protein